SFKSDLPTDKTFVTLHDKPATEYYKDEFEALVEKNDREIIMCGLRKDLGTLSVDRYYRNEFFFDDTYDYQVLNVPEEAKIIHETDGKIWGMKIGNIQIVACQPKFPNSIENTVQFADLPKTDKIGLDADSYLKDMLKIKFHTYGNNLIKAAEYRLKGLDTFVFHTTDPKGGNSVTIKTKKNCSLYQFCTDITENLKAGEEYTITFPETDYTDKTIGAGKGTVKITGITGNDIEFINIPKDNILENSEKGFEISGLADGLKLPQPKKLTEMHSPTVESQKAFAGYNYGLKYYEKNELYKAEEIWREFVGMAEPEVFRNMCLGLGNCNLLHGHTFDAYNYYTDALRPNPFDTDLKTALGCLYFKTDRDKAIELWKEANTEEAKHNLSISE
ncbi:MAG: hypothetical protein KBT47_09650, partial [Armatimonadetes bacterium]|nr:hypothetical protein [Candidatus Hippobium faecium]